MSARDVAELAAELAEIKRPEPSLNELASEEVANVVENARHVVAARCSCAECIAIIDRAIANLTDWRYHLTLRRPGERG